jgi:hypothetical protein
MCRDKFPGHGEISRRVDLHTLKTAGINGMDPQAAVDHFLK